MILSRLAFAKYLQLNPWTFHYKGKKLIYLYVPDSLRHQKIYIHTSLYMVNSYNCSAFSYQISVMDSSYLESGAVQYQFQGY